MTSFVNTNSHRLKEKGGIITSLFLTIFVFRQVFAGNQEAYETKKNVFFPPVIGRFIRLYPIDWLNKATIRMEFYGCELDGKM